MKVELVKLDQRIGVLLCAGRQKRAEPFVFALNFLWLLSLFQNKESDKQTIVATDSG
jgi:hypothetical protein